MYFTKINFFFAENSYGQEHRKSRCFGEPSAPAFSAIKGGLGMDPRPMGVWKPFLEQHELCLRERQALLGEGIRSMYKRALTKYLLTKHRHYAGA